MGRVTTAGLTSTLQRRPNGDVTIEFHGEIDLETARTARDDLVNALEPGRTVTVGLADVGFMDSSGLSALVYALRAAKAIDARVRVEDPQPWVRKLFSTAGVAGLFGLEEGDERSASPPTVRPRASRAAIEEACALLQGYEKLLRWGDLTPEQVTIALGGGDLADGSEDLELAQRVRAALDELGAARPTVVDDD